VSIETKEPLVVGQTPKEYTSMYGYPKRGFNVFAQSDAEQTSSLGFIKEEIVYGADGKEPIDILFDSGVVRARRFRSAGPKLLPRQLASQGSGFLRRGAKQGRSNG